MNLKASRAAVALLAAGALVLTGCADKKSDDSAAGGTTAAAQSGASGSPSAAHLGSATSRSRMLPSTSLRLPPPDPV